MADGKVSSGGCSNMSVLLHKDRLLCDPLIRIPNSSASNHGANSIVNFENAGGRETIDTPLFQSRIGEENGDDDLDFCFTSAGKKRRLTASQVQFLEWNFKVENKLEPERKIQLAKELGLQPRQVAIWFQNRRARFKNKQLEKDYDSLKASYDKLKFDYENLFKEKEYLRNEVLSLREKLIIRNARMEDSEALDNINSSNAELQNLIPNLISEYVSNASSANFDSDPADSSRLLEPDQSDFSQDEEDNLSRSFLPPSPCFPNSCTFEFPVEDQPLWSWTY